MIEHNPGFSVTATALLVLLFLQIPVIIVILASFSETSYLTIPPQGWTLKWFENVLTSSAYLSAIKNSLILAISSTILSLILGVSASYTIFRKLVPGSEALTSLLMSPLIIPAVVIGVAMLQFFTLIGFRGSFSVLIVAHVVITVPYIIRSALASLSGVDASLEEASRVLGADGWTTFRLITLPLIKPGLVAGALFSFVTSMENVPVTIFLAGPRDTTLPILIFTSVEMGVDPSVAAVSTLLIIATAIVLLIAERWAGFHKFV